MIVGQVVRRADGPEIVDEPIVFLDVQSFSGENITIEAVVDTGFSGELSLTAEQIFTLNLPLRGQSEAVMADGSLRVTPTYTAIVVWHGVERLTSIDGVDPVPLIGMALLRGSRLIVDAEEGGIVQIEPRSVQPA